eukprot:11151-Heterococcus_DN1.PRE.1
MYDLGNRIIATLHMPTEHDKQLQARQELLKTVIPRVFDGLEHRLQPSGYVVGSSISAADIMLHQSYKWLTGDKVEGIPSSCLDAYSTVRKCVQNVDNHPEHALLVDAYVCLLRCGCYAIRSSKQRQNSQGNTQWVLNANEYCTCAPVAYAVYRITAHLLLLLIGNAVQESVETCESAYVGSEGCEPPCAPTAAVREQCSTEQSILYAQRSTAATACLLLRSAVAGCVGANKHRTQQTASTYCYTSIDTHVAISTSLSTCSSALSHVYCLPYT